MKSEIKMCGGRLQMTRLFEAPRDLVFEWWSKPEKLQQWSGCNEAVRCEFVVDFRPGGSFTQQMELLVQGKTCDFTITGTYDEIVVPSKIACWFRRNPQSRHRDPRRLWHDLLAR